MNSSAQPELAVSQDLLIDKLCNEFEDAWKAQQTPRLEEFLTRVSESTRPALMRELVEIDYRYRLLANEKITPAAYAERFPDLFLTEYLESPPAGATPQPDTIAAPRAGRADAASMGQRLGDYELLAKIAQGGMGVVYRARQYSLNREVAVKLIRSGELASEKEFQRFQIEAEAAASLDHPNIVPVYDFGVENGVHFLAMKLVEGGSLTTKLGDFGLPAVASATPPHGGNHASTRTASAARQRLIAKVLATLARAVHYAHERGILHRDLKPANILMDGAGQPHITDFGLAKRVGGAPPESDTGQLTQTGMILGTPSYMAPEQARGDKGLTTAVDVYALGAVLYHLLTGVPPFQAETPFDVVVKVQTEEPARPRHKQPAAALDLETICLKCLRKEPTARYRSAQELALDLERFERGDAIQARPASNWEKTRRWCGRHKMVASLAAVIVLLLVGGTTGAISLAVWALSEKGRADETVIKEREARDLADTNFALAEKAVAESLENVANDPALSNPALVELRKKLLMSAAPFYEEFVKQKQGDERLEVRRGLAYERLAFLHYQLGQHDRAVADYEKMRDVFQNLAEAFPTNPEHRCTLAATHNNLANEFANLNRHAESEAEYRRALAIATALVAEFEDNRSFQQQLARAQGGVALRLRDRGQIQDAEDDIERAVELFKRIFDENPKDLMFGEELARSYGNLGALRKEQGRLEEAIHEFLRALDVCKPLLTASPYHTQLRKTLAWNYLNLGGAYYSLRKFGEAEVSFRKAIDHFQWLADVVPVMPDYRHMLAKSRTELGFHFMITNRYKEAVEQLERAVEGHERVVNDFPQTPEYDRALSRCQHVLGNSLGYLGKHAEAETQLRRGVERRKRHVDQQPDSPELQSQYAAILHDLVLRLNYRGEYKEGRQLLELAIVHQRNAVSALPNHPDYAWFLRNHHVSLGITHVELGDHEQALRTARELNALRPEHALNAFDAARIAAGAATGVRGNQTLAEEVRGHRSQAYADEAMALLKEAVRRGYANVKDMRQHPPFGILSNRSDYQKLLNEVEIKAKRQK